MASFYNTTELIRVLRVAIKHVFLLFCHVTQYFPSSQASNLLSSRRYAATMSLARRGDLLHSALTCLSSADARRLKSRHPCTRRTTTYRFSWQQHTCGAVGGSPMECGVGGQPHKTQYFHPRHRHSPPGMTLPRTAWVRLNCLPRCRGFPLMRLYKCGMVSCGLWVWCRRTSRRPCCPPMSNPSTSSWTARPGGSGRWDNRMAGPRASAWLEEFAQKMNAVLSALG